MSLTLGIAASAGVLAASERMLGHTQLMLSDFSVAFLRNVPVEVLESEVPVLVHRYGLVADSEGAGEFRGDRKSVV